MKKVLIVLLFQILIIQLFAHHYGHGSNSKTWHLKIGNELIIADFIQETNGLVYLSDANHNLLKINLTDFVEEDQKYILKKSNWIKAANHPRKETGFPLFSYLEFCLILFGGLMIVFSLFKYKERKHIRQFATAILGIILILTACEGPNSAIKDSIALSTKVPANNLDFLRSIFGAFEEVNTRHNDQYFFIESNGLPNHEMMTGITNWQQQVPIPHDYSGENSWAIPIQPKLAANPLSTKDNFMKGAIAIAANGIPIFNPLNNRGEDANAIGELDRWGGHCGRADDYHYHLPPTHLQSKVGKGKPIAYALDGFPVYGETTKELDEYLGRFNLDSSYQYHASKEYPYLIAGMRGIVKINPRTKAPENEITPQAKTKGVRPPLRPLKNAIITDFKKVNPNQYRLTYSIKNQTYFINYGWEDNGKYSFQLMNPDGTNEVSNFQRK